MMSSKSDVKNSVLSDKYKKIALDMGFSVNESFDSCLFIEKDGYHYRLDFHPANGKYICFVFGVAIKADEDSQRLRVYEAINEVNEKFVVVKAVYDVEGAVEFGCETWVYSDRIIEAFIHNSIRVIHQAFDLLGDKISDIVFEE